MIAGGLVHTAVVVTLDPYHHRVRTMGPTDTAICTGGRVVDRGQTRYVGPGMTQRYITRRGSTDRTDTDKLVLDLQAFTRTTRTLMGKVLIDTQLRHIGEIPIFRLGIARKLCSRPILKMRVRKLLCHYRRKTD